MKYTGWCQNDFNAPAGGGAVPREQRHRVAEGARVRARGVGAVHAWPALTSVKRESYRVGPKVASWPNILTEMPY